MLMQSDTLINKKNGPEAESLQGRFFYLQKIIIDLVWQFVDKQLHHFAESA